MSYRDVIINWLNNKPTQNYEEKLENGLVRIMYTTYRIWRFSSSITIDFTFDAWKLNKTKNVTRRIRFRVKRTDPDPVLKFNWFYLSIISIEDKKHPFVDDFLQLLKNKPFQLEDKYTKYRGYDYNGYIMTYDIIDKIKPSHLLINQWTYNMKRLTQNCGCIVIRNDCYCWTSMKIDSPINKLILLILHSSEIYNSILYYLVKDNNYIIYYESSYTYITEVHFNDVKHEPNFKSYAANNDIHKLYYVPLRGSAIDLTHKINRYREKFKLSQVLMQPNNVLIHHKLSFPSLLDYIYKFLE